MSVGRKHARNARRRGQHVAEEVERARVAAGGDPAHVPDRGALSVEIGGHHEKPASLPIFARHRLQNVGIDVGGDQIAQRAGLVDAGAEQSGDPVGLQQVRQLAAGEDGPQRRVVGRSEKRERRDQRAGAGAGHEGEFRPRPALAPSGQQAGAERAVGAAAGQGEHGRLPLQDARRAGRPPLADGRIIAPQAGPRNAGNGGLGLLLRAIGDAGLGGAAREHERASGQGDPSGRTSRARGNATPDHRHQPPFRRMEPGESARQEPDLGFGWRPQPRSCAVSN